MGLVLPPSSGTQKALSDIDQKAFKTVHYKKRYSIIDMGHLPGTFPLKGHNLVQERR